MPAVLEFTVRHLSAHPKIQSNLRAEVLSSTLSVTSDSTYAMIDKLPYLNAIVMESLRLVDTVSSYQTRVVPNGGCTISGFYVPGGVSTNFLLQGFLTHSIDNRHGLQTVVSAQPYLINRLPDIFHDPEIFDPSRWLLPSESYRALAKHMWAFSSGPRGCIGKELSLAGMFMLKILFTSTLSFC